MNIEKEKSCEMIPDATYPAWKKEE